MPGPLSYKWDCSQRPLPQAQWALGVPKGIRSFLLQTCSSSWVPQLTGKHHPWANCPRPIMSLLTRLLLLSQPGTRIMATSCQLCLPVISGIGSFGPTSKSHCHVRSGQLLTRPLGIPSPPPEPKPPPATPSEAKSLRDRRKPRIQGWHHRELALHRTQAGCQAEHEHTGLFSC